MVHDFFNGGIISFMHITALFLQVHLRQLVVLFIETTFGRSIFNLVYCSNS